MRARPFLAQVLEQAKRAHLVEGVADDDQIGFLFLQPTDGVVPRFTADDFRLLGGKQPAQVPDHCCRRGDEYPIALRAHRPEPCKRRAGP